jgi:hypothetical protein
MEDNGFTVDAVTAAIAGDKESFLNAFNNAIANKVTDALELKKVEIASNLLDAGQQEVVAHEVDGTQTEVDGSAGISAEVAEVATTEV